MKNNATANPRKRIFHLVQYLNHPKTNEPLFDVEMMKKELKERNSIKRYAWIIHNQDLDDEGNVKPPHIHLIFETPGSPVHLLDVSEWFQVPPQYIQLPKGRGAFLDVVEYLTHRRHPEKAQYDNSDVVANFDWLEALDARGKKVMRGGEMVSPRSALRYDVLQGKYTIKEAKELFPNIYKDDGNRLKQLRNDYLSNAEPPLTRMNYYISGEAGSGKSLLSMALARHLFPHIEEPFFRVGGKNVKFEGYDGQPVIIWDDARASQLISEIGRSELFQIFDTFPQKVNFNVKNSKVNLINAINIVNGIEDYRTFMDSLAGEYFSKRDNVQYESEDKNQVYRRFPMVIPVDDDLTILVNKGYFSGTREFAQYVQMGKFKNYLPSIYANASTMGLDWVKAKEKINIEGVMTIHNDIVAQKTPPVMIPDSINAIQFEGLGVNQVDADAIDFIQKWEKLASKVNNIYIKDYGAYQEDTDFLDVYEFIYNYYFLMGLHYQQINIIEDRYVVDEFQWFRDNIEYFPEKFKSVYNIAIEDASSNDVLKKFYEVYNEIDDIEMRYQEAISD